MKERKRFHGFKNFLFRQNLINSDKISFYHSNIVPCLKEGFLSKKVPSITTHAKWISFRNFNFASFFPICLKIRETLPPCLQVQMYQTWMQNLSCSSKVKKFVRFLCRIKSTVMEKNRGDETFLEGVSKTGKSYGRMYTLSIKVYLSWLASQNIALACILIVSSSLP